MPIRVIQPGLRDFILTNPARGEMIITGNK